MIGGGGYNSHKEEREFVITDAKSLLFADAKCSEKELKCLRTLNEISHYTDYTTGKGKSHDTIIKQYNDLISLYPQKVEIYLSLGEYYFKYNSIKKAQEVYALTKTKFPSCIPAYSRLADIAYQQYMNLNFSPGIKKRQDQLKNDVFDNISAILFLDPENVPGLMLKGAFCELIGWYNDALDCFLKVIETESANVYAYLNLAKLY